MATSALPGPMPRIAVYECACCGGRVSRPVPPYHRATPRLRCEGWCLRCGGSCRDVARRVAVEQEEAPDVVAEAIVAERVRLVKPSPRLDLPDFRPQDLAW